MRLSVNDVVRERDLVRDGADEHGGEAFRTARRAIEAELLDQARPHLRAGADVAYDEGLWTRARRDCARRVADDCGADVRLLFFTADPLAQWQRIGARRRG